MPVRSGWRCCGMPMVAAAMPTPTPTSPSVPGETAAHDAVAAPAASNPGGPLSLADLPKNLLRSGIEAGRCGWASGFWRIRRGWRTVGCQRLRCRITRMHRAAAWTALPNPIRCSMNSYFWLVDAAIYDVPTQLGTLAGLAGGSQTANSNGLQDGYQDAYYGQSDQQAELWQDPDVLPQLLDWEPVSAVRLAWCRVHDGEFQEPRQSDKRGAGDGLGPGRSCVPRPVVRLADLLGDRGGPAICRVQRSVPTGVPL